MFERIISMLRSIAFVDAGVAERQNYCIVNDTPHHDTSAKYATGFELRILSFIGVPSMIKDPDTDETIISCQRGRLNTAIIFNQIYTKNSTEISSCRPRCL